VRIGLNDLKTMIDFDISNKERSGHSPAVEENKLQKDRKKS